jgi:iron complex outermembrane recepter protein
MLAGVMLLSTPAALSGQTVGIVQGTVVHAVDGAPLTGATVQVGGTDIGTLTDARGRFQLIGVPLGRHEIVARRLGFSVASDVVEVTAGEPAIVSFRLTEQALLVPEVIVSAARETQRLSETAASVGVISAEELQASRPAHPSAVMSQIPGVWVSVTGGEGHMTAIRQPQTTKPVYLFLEDGVPTRSTGFFNHNALYEVNLPQADRVEVLKGPASALYGSDAIGGVVNVETRRPSFDPAIEGFVEGGGFGYSRLLASASNTWGSQGLRADLNLTRTDGWRDATGYDRQSATFRWDSYLDGNTTVRTVATVSRIDQQTAGSSALPRYLFKTSPRVNRTPISNRTVEAGRVSTNVEVRRDRTLVSVTPFARWNEMDLLPNWALTYDPTISTTGHRSIGVLARVRRDLDPVPGRVIAGIDLDHSPGSRTEHRIGVTLTDSIFTSYTVGDVIYDYDVTFQAISPYVQAELSPMDALHLTAGLRFDRLGYSYRSRLEPLSEGRWRRPSDTDLTYSSFSPKLGASYDLGRPLNLFANYTRGFRAPSEGQIFRQGTASNTIGLSPVTADSYEIGARGEIVGRVGYSLALYRMSVKNDILSFTHPDGTPETQNAGETLHQGFEAGLNVMITEDLRGNVSYSRARHTYEQWSPRSNIHYAGNEMESAPNTIVNARLTYTPGFMAGARVGAEWNRIGGYWLNAENTHRYEGHDLFNLNATIPVLQDLEVVGRLINLADSRYAETASYTERRGEELAPGVPRTLYLGLQYRWGR